MSCVYAYREDANDTEHEYSLVYEWAAFVPASRWQPAEGGIEPDGWYCDGAPIDECAIPEDVAEELLCSADERALA